MHSANNIMWRNKYMALKRLNQFLRFDFPGFSDGKIYQVTGISEWIDFESKKHIGTKIEVVIVEDKTKYAHRDGEVISNRYEKLVIKVKKDIKVPIDARVEPVNPVATVYGDYRNQLSIVADDIRIVLPRAVESPKVRV